ncbi:MAG: ATP-binding protein, partial [Gammaproteobacteria bacterium]|nr:ATP-binding protein [Gammaproteobacteria bacterium]
MANASVHGSRYIITGVEIEARGRRKLRSIERGDFSGKPAYESLATDHIEPPIRIQHQAVTVDGARLGVFKIGDCQDRPYMMRVDHSETLRRGDAYVRMNDSAVKMGRRQLQALFEKKFQDSVSAASIEIGFPGEIIHKKL